MMLRLALADPLGLQGLGRGCHRAEPCLHVPAVQTGCAAECFSAISAAEGSRRQQIVQSPAELRYREVRYANSSTSSAGKNWWKREILQLPNADSHSRPFGRIAPSPTSILIRPISGGFVPAKQKKRPGRRVSAGVRREHNRWTVCRSLGCRRRIRLSRLVFATR